ncbi:MAG: hypothetical protein D6726_05850 [Nitrospirae bacterium]|nr:MAG: hypothetical protein D6726_05850 [Nitrospirota bacterium]
MRKLTIVIFLISLIFLFSHQVYADIVASYEVIDGSIVTVGHIAMVDIDGGRYVISSENSAYLQFEGRIIRMYGVVIDDEGRITFKGFRFIDAFA